MVSAIILASDTSKKMQAELKEKKIKTKNKLLLRVNYKLIIDIVYSVLDSGVEECLLILKDDVEEISQVVLSEIRDEKLKIINSESESESEIILEGINKIKQGLCLFVASDQPAISPDTFKKLINNAKEDSNVIPILSRKNIKLLNFFNGLELPFLCNTADLKKYLSNKNNINSVLKDMKKDFEFFYVKPINEIELIKVNDCNDYEKLVQGKNYKNPLYNSIISFLSLRNLSINFKIYFIIFFISAILSLFLYSKGLPNIDLDNSASMISTLIQSEASIIAIVITLSLVAVQLTSSSYSSRVIEIFKRELSFWILIVSYIIAIIYGLIILPFVNISEIIIVIDIYIAIFALFSLIPYILDILDLMKPNTIIKKLEKRISDHDVLSFLRMDHKKDPLQPIFDVIYSSLKRYDYRTLKDGLDSVSEYNERIYTNKTTFRNEKRIISNHILEQLARVGDITVNMKEDYATSQVLLALSTNAQLSKEISKDGYELTEVIYHITKIAKSAVENDLRSSIFHALTIFNTLAVFRKFDYVTRQILSAVEDIEEYSTDIDVLKQIFGLKILLESIMEDDSEIGDDL